MSVKSWLKQNQLFDKYIVEEFNKQNITNLPFDLATVSDQKWRSIRRWVLGNKQKDGIKDSQILFRTGKKLDKIDKIRKKQITISSPKATVSPKAGTPKVRTPKVGTPKAIVKPKELWNPSFSFFNVIKHWIRIYDTKNKYAHNICINIIKYYPLFGSGKDGNLVVKQNETLRLDSNHEYDFMNIVLHKDSKLTVNKKGNEADGGRLYLSCLDTLTMNEGSQITVKGCGEAGNKDGNAGGGLYGIANTCRYIQHYTNNNELKLGTGGDGHFWNRLKQYPGGNGGGILKIECTNLIMNKSCLLTANGNGNENGGGSGGIVWLRCLQFFNKGKRSCIISSEGGKPNGDQGRVRIDAINQSTLKRIKKIILCSNIHVMYMSSNLETVKSNNFSLSSIAGSYSRSKKKSRHQRTQSALVITNTEKRKKITRHKRTASANVNLPETFRENKKQINLEKMINRKNIKTKKNKNQKDDIISLRSWLKKCEVFDKDILEEFQSRNITNLPTDLISVTDRKWRTIQRSVVSKQLKSGDFHMKKVKIKLSTIDKVRRKGRGKNSSSKTNLSTILNLAKMKDNDDEKLNNK